MIHIVLKVVALKYPYFISAVMGVEKEPRWHAFGRQVIIVGMYIISLGMQSIAQ